MPLLLGWVDCTTALPLPLASKNSAGVDTCYAPASRVGGLYNRITITSGIQKQRWRRYGNTQNIIAFDFSGFLDIFNDSSELHSHPGVQYKQYMYELSAR